ncbi:EAL domain-containing protein [Rhodocyclus tenuis]|uniref:EAL domain-containing protein (Putative c-di-GMP-specific phosphodiesterase class I)/GGDEF domain-containing protein n=1 Tax=Rhodocyclus tenuis TaxID=1066 RepID=A0A840GKZ5_RHOTE|nr:EAL domain-containing protein [Rhodocyclus tenuis]MBB4249102.1 EAL domain-containing protein (putative c-di-GMP-specific phosphodiesterase class I)/GGDEF domain-containing protein [Rhodocyclus tenuis]
MTLRRQLVLMGALVFALALLGIAVGQWQAGRQFVREQMAAHVQETATSLALALTSAMRDGDAVLVRTQLLPIFDRGYYRRIAVRDLAGRVVAAEDLAPVESGVPDWFSALVQFEAPHAEALVNSGWQQSGRVEVDGDADFALRQLWRGTVHALAWLFAVYALALALMLLWLRRLLAPMGAVERIASAAAGRRIAPIDLQTKVRELANFIAGFNRIAGMFNARLAEEEARAERFRAATLNDALTGLLNRHGLEAVFAGAAAPRWLGLIEAEGVDVLNRSAGYAAGDEFVRAIGERVRRSFPQARLARLHAASFAIALGEALPGADADATNGGPTASFDEDTLQQRSQELLVAVADIAALFPGLAVRCGAAWVAGTASASLSTLLGDADLALAEARNAGAGRVLIRRETSSGGLGAQATLRRVEAAITARDFVLSCQPVYSLGGEQLLQTEVFLRLRTPDGELWPARNFLPLLQRDADGSVFDRAMLDCLRRAVDAGQLPPGPLAANLSAASFADGTLPDWLAATLSDWPRAFPLVFELREADLTASLAAAERFAGALRNYAVGIAIDHFGTQAGGIAALRRLLPQYVKLDAGLSRGLDAVERRFLVESLVRAAHSLEVPVWAQVFESPGALDLLAGMGIVGAQGYTMAGERTLAG